MDYYLKEYGLLKNVTIAEKYASGEIESFKVEELNNIYINGVEYVPRYSINDDRKKEFPSIRLYKSGKLKTLDLENITTIKTTEHIFSAEKLVFYETGEIKRIFPLNGKISGYWSEDDEYNLAEAYDFNFKFAFFKSKVISIQLFKNGKVKSITLWPKDKVSIKYNSEKINVRIGISLYDDGNLKTCESACPTKINTPIGEIEAFDKNAFGIHGEDNSLKFYNDGSIKALTTSTKIIKIIDKKGNTTIHSPKEVFHYSGSLVKDIITVSIEFKENKVIIDGTSEYLLYENKFIIEQFGEKKLTLKGDL